MYCARVTLPACRMCGFGEMRGKHVVMGWTRGQDRGQGQEMDHTDGRLET